MQSKPRTVNMQKASRNIEAPNMRKRELLVGDEDNSPARRERPGTVPDR
jgi:hypothetical protein